MKERPILFSAPMVRALLAGTKLQTRRVVKLPHMNPLGEWEPMSWGGPNGGRTRTGHTVPLQQAIGHSRTGEILGCPYGQPGDRLWVRENGWQPPADRAERGWPYAYDADAPFGVSAANEAYREEGWKRRPSIHMPRWASRILLEVTDVRVERLQDISRGNAMAEGCPFPNLAHGDDPRKWYADLWDEINGAGAWAANPWVWAVTFKRVKLRPQPVEMVAS